MLVTWRSLKYKPLILGFLAFSALSQLYGLGTYKTCYESGVRVGRGGLNSVK